MEDQGRSQSEHILLRATPRKTLAEEELLRLVVRQRECPQLGCSGLLMAAKFQQKCSPNGVKQMIRFKIVRKGFDLAPGHRWPSHIPHRYSPVQPDDWRGGQDQQQIIEGQDLRLVRGLPRLGFRVASHKRGLDLVGTRTAQCRRLLDQSSCVANHLSIPV